MEIVILLAVLAVVLVVGGVTFVGLRSRRGTDLEPPPSARLDPTGRGGVLVEEPPVTAPSSAVTSTSPLSGPSW